MRPPSSRGPAVGLLIHLLGLELSLYFLHLRAVLPLAPASAPIQLDSAGEQVSAFASGWQQVEQSSAQVGQPQRFVEFLLLRAQLIEQQLYLNESMSEMADGEGREPLVIRAQGIACSSWWRDTQ